MPRPTTVRRLTRRELLTLMLLTGGALATSAACGQAGRNTTAAQPPQTSVPTAPATQSPIAAATGSQPPPTARPTIAAPAPSVAITVTPAPQAQDPYPDTIYTGGKVITIDASDTVAQAVAIKNGLIQAVGTTDRIRALAGARTATVDLKGKTVTPGLIDAHCHVAAMGLIGPYYEGFMPPEVKTIEDMQAKLAAMVAKTPAGEWIKGVYIGMGGPTPTKADLDPASPKNPVWLMQQGGHYGTANSLALKVSGVTNATPSPSGGVIAKDSSGQLTGLFYNHRAMDLIKRNLPIPPVELVYDGIVSTHQAFAACGVTSLQDCNVRGIDMVNAYLDVYKQGKMSLRCAIWFTLEWPQDVDIALKEIKLSSSPFMSVYGYKFLIDGQTPTAYCHEPHKGVRWDLSTWEPQMFKTAIRQLHETGGQVCVHCIGDAAADLTLDAYDEALKAKPRADARHRIEHALLTTAAATKRMKDLGVVVSTQPAFIRLGGDYWPTQFGAERDKRIIVTREWLNAGVALALGSDAPTGPWYTPQMTLAGAISRRTLSNKTQGADQVLTIQEALRAHTLGAAYAAHEEKTKGSIEVGKLGDLTVWNEDPYGLSVERLAQTTIAMTIVGGKTVYQDTKT